MADYVSYDKNVGPWNLDYSEKRFYPDLKYKDEKNKEAKKNTDSKHPLESVFTEFEKYKGTDSEIFYILSLEKRKEVEQYYTIRTNFSIVQFMMDYYLYKKNGNT